MASADEFEPKTAGNERASQAPAKDDMTRARQPADEVDKRANDVVTGAGNSVYATYVGEGPGSETTAAPAPSGSSAFEKQTARE